MRPRRSPFAVVLSVVALAACAVVSAPAGAAAPEKVAVSGEIVLRLSDNVAEPPRTIGRNTRIDAVATVTFVGDIAGPAVEPYRAIVLPTGRTTQFGTGIFEGEIAGRTGTFRYVFHGDAATGGVITITGGTGELAGIHGRLRFYPVTEGTTDPARFGYEGTVTLR